MMCTSPGQDSVLKGSCKGDSGSPLHYFDEDKQAYVQTGMVSWAKGCALKDYPSVHARLSVHMDWIKQTKKGISCYNGESSNYTARYTYYQDMQNNTGSGMYPIWIGGYYINVYCDFQTDGGGWTVLQKRGDNGNPEDFFYRNWTDYEQGFGNPEEDYWVGLRYWNIITQSEDVQMLISLEDVEGNKIEASYTNFKISDWHDNYRMTFYAAESKYDSLTYSKGQQFSTRDRDNDGSDYNCAIDR